MWYELNYSRFSRDGRTIWYLNRGNGTVYLLPARCVVKENHDAIKSDQYVGRVGRSP